MNWKLNYTIEEQIATILCDGEILGEDQGPDLIEVVNNILSKKIAYAVLDISEIKYINSSGIGVLITVMTKFRNAQGDVVLLKPSSHVNKLLKMTKLDSIFYVAEDMEQAKNKLRSK